MLARFHDVIDVESPLLGLHRGSGGFYPEIQLISGYFAVLGKYVINFGLLGTLRDTMGCLGTPWDTLYPNLPAAAVA